MPPRKEIPPLRLLALERLYNMIHDITIRQCNELRPSRDRNVINEFVEDRLLPISQYIYGSIADDQINDVHIVVVNSISSTLSTIRSEGKPLEIIFLIAFHPRLKCIDFTYIPLTSHILCNNEINGLDLISVDILSAFRRLEEITICCNTPYLSLPNNLFSNLSQQLRNLRKLTIHYNATDTLVETVVTQCEQLFMLSLDYSRNVTDRSVQFIQQARQLQFLGIMYTSITVNGLLYLALNAPQITDYGDDIATGRLLHVAIVNGVEGLILRRIVLDHCLRWYYVNSVFPYLRCMHFVGSGDANDPCPITVMTEYLRSELRLSTLVLQYTRFNEVRNLNLFLRSIRPSFFLINLHLCFVSRVEYNTLAIISKFCPCLQSLTICHAIVRRCTVHPYSHQYFSDENGCLNVDWENIPPPRRPMFTNLLCFHAENANLSDWEIRQILYSCYSIRYVFIQNVYPTLTFSDSLLLAILGHNPMLELRKFYISNSSMTAMSLFSLFHSCLELRCVRVNEEAILNCYVVAVFKRMVKRGNYDLTVNCTARDAFSPISEFIHHSLI